MQFLFLFLKQWSRTLYSSLDNVQNTLDHLNQKKVQKIFQQFLLCFEHDQRLLILHFFTLL